MTNISGKHEQLSSLFNLLKEKLHLRSLLPPANSDNRTVRHPRNTFLRPSAAVTGVGLRQLKEFNHRENILWIFLDPLQEESLCLLISEFPLPMWWLHNGYVINIYWMNAWMHEWIISFWECGSSQDRFSQLLNLSNYLMEQHYYIYSIIYVSIYTYIYIYIHRHIY